MARECIFVLPCVPVQVWPDTPDLGSGDKAYKVLLSSPRHAHHPSCMARYDERRAYRLRLPVMLTILAGVLITL
jgi:hypothetical protein